MNTYLKKITSIALIALLILVSSFAFLQEDAEAATAKKMKVSKKSYIFYHDETENQTATLTVTLSSSDAKLYYRVGSDEKYRTSGTAGKYSYEQPKVKKISQDGKKVKLKIDIKELEKGGTDTIYLKDSKTKEIRKIKVYTRRGLKNYESSEMQPDTLNCIEFHDKLTGETSFATSDETIVSIDETGTMKALMPGKATITAKIGKREFKHEVTVPDAAEELKKLASYIQEKGSYDEEKDFYMVGDQTNSSVGRTKYSNSYFVCYYPADEEIKFMGNIQSVRYNEKWIMVANNAEIISATVSLDPALNDEIELTYTGMFSDNKGILPQMGNGVIENPKDWKGWTYYQNGRNLPDGSKFSGIAYNGLNSSYNERANQLYCDMRLQWSLLSFAKCNTDWDKAGIGGMYN